jgi:hypothetical protein
MHELGSKFGQRSWGKRAVLWRIATLLAIGCAVSCRKPLSPLSLRTGLAPPDASPMANPSPARLVVVLLTIDGVRWQELTRGIDTELARSAGVTHLSASALTPNLHALLDRGGGMLDAQADCPGILASGPNFLSLPGYAEIISGHRSAGCRDNGCNHVRVSTLIDEFAQRFGAGPTNVAVVTSWPDIQRLTRAHADSVAVSAGRHGGSTRSLFEHDREGQKLLDVGAGREPYPGQGDFRPDPDTARLALHRLATRQPSFMWIGLGEPDEYGHRGDYAGYVRSLIYADVVVGQLDALLEAIRRAGDRTALFVTTDHGRAYNFRDHGEKHIESSRVWLVAAGSEIQRRGRIACSSAHHLADIAPTIRELAGLGLAQDVNAGRPIDSLVQRHSAGSGALGPMTTPRASLQSGLAY